MDLISLTQAPKTAEEAHAPAIAQGARCNECPLYGCRQGPVLGEIRPNAKLTIIGEAPGMHEVREKRPFVGMSGAELNAALEAGGVPRESCSVTNTLLCRPPSQAEGESLDDYLESLNRRHRRAVAEAEKAGLPLPHPPVSPFDACRPRLERDIAASNSKVLLAVGGKALQGLAHHFGVPYGTGGDTVGRIALATIKSQHGSPMLMPDGRILCSSLHPAFAARKNRQYTQVVRENIRRAALIAERGHIDWQVPAFDIFVPAPTDTATSMSTPLEALERIEKICADMVLGADFVACDIETDSAEPQHCGLRCVGLGAVVNGVEKVVVIPVKWMDGRKFWPLQAMWDRVVRAIRSILDHKKLLFHNGIFDTTVLLRTGLMTDEKKRYFDTILAHHDTDSNDLPHDLGFVARQFLEAPLWKKDVDHKHAAGVAKDYDLHYYNALDVLVTLRLWPKLYERVVACDTKAQLKVDLALAPIARDMGRLGIWIDEAVRGDLSLKLNELCIGLRAKFQQLAEKPNMNPNSPPQVKAWLYDELGLTKHDASGEELDEDDEDLDDSDASTGNAALFKIVDLLAPDGKPVDLRAKQTIDAIDTLLEFRACDKLRGTYVDKLPVHYGETRTPWNTKHDGPDAEIADEVMFKVMGGGGDVPAVIRSDGKETLPRRSALSRLYVGWKLHVVPSGRWACKPTVHNWPSRGWMIDGKPTNTRRMVVAPPGHVIVGADYEQLELRAYGVIANDKYVIRSFRETVRVNGKDVSDPHCLNAATILAEREADIEAMYLELLRQHYWPVDKAEASKIKYTRTVAKRVCIAEGSPVLTDRGEVPIEQVTLLDKVWDGVEWVSHEGLIDQGIQEVIEWDGVCATPDHVVWTEDGETMELRAARASERRLAVTGRGGDPLRFVHDDVGGLAHGQSSQGDGALSVRHGERDVPRQSDFREVERLSRMQVGAPATSDAAVAALSDEQRALALYESEQPVMEGLRRSGDRVPLLFDRNGRSLGDRELGAGRRELGDRPYQQRRTLRTGQSPLGVCDAQCAESSLRPTEAVARDGDTGGLGVSSARMAVRRMDSPLAAREGTITSADLREGAPNRRDEGTWLARDPRETPIYRRVYDLINAGARHRFTVSERLVNNCYLKNYGGEADKLYAAMAAERDKATNRRVFPGLKKERVDEWEERWDRRHPEKATWHQRIAWEVRQKGYIATPVLSRRKRYFIGGPNKKNAPPNHEIQGTGSEFANEAVLRLHEAIPFGCWSPYTGLYLQVHDYLAVCVPESRAEEAAKILEKAMYFEMPCADGWMMPFPAKAVISKNWADNA